PTGTLAIRGPDLPGVSQQPTGCPVLVMFSTQTVRSTLAGPRMLIRLTLAAVASFARSFVDADSFAFARGLPRSGALVLIRGSRPEARDVPPAASGGWTRREATGGRARAGADGRGAGGGGGVAAVGVAAAVPARAGAGAGRGGAERGGGGAGAGAARADGARPAARLRGRRAGRAGAQAAPRPAAHVRRAGGGRADRAAARGAARGRGALDAGDRGGRARGAAGPAGQRRGGPAPAAAAALLVAAGQGVDHQSRPGVRRQKKRAERLVGWVSRAPDRRAAVYIDESWFVLWPSPAPGWAPRGR